MYKYKIRKYFEDHREEYLSDLDKLIAINSERGEAKEGMPYGEGPAKALDEALKIAEKYGMHVQNWENYVGTADFMGKDERTLDIMAHLDIVPVGEGWTVTEPLVMKEVDGHIYGRGTADDKGPALAALYAMRAIKELEIPISKNVRLMFGCDEECGSSDLEYYFSKTEPAEMTFTPDADFPVINIEKGIYNGKFYGDIKSEGEKSIISIYGGERANVVPNTTKMTLKGFTVDELREAVVKLKDICEAEFEIIEKDGEIVITANGKSAHASTPEEGCNSNTCMLELIKIIDLSDSDAVSKIRKIADIFPHGETNGKSAGINISDEESGEITAVLSVIKYDGEKFEALMDSRAPISGSYETFDTIRKYAEENGIGYSDKFEPPHYVSAESEFIKTLIASYEKYSGKKGKAKAIGGGTYVHDIENAVAFGCVMEGEETNMHGVDEHASVDTLLMSGMIFAEAIYQLCK